MINLETAILSALRDARLPCAFAFRLMSDGEWTPAQVGAEADRLNVRISRCQLGLFGYESFRQKNLLTTFDDVPGDITVSLRGAAVEGAIPCASAWRIADEHGLPKLAIACAAETLGLQISPCQLGCF